MEKVSVTIVRLRFYRCEEKEDIIMAKVSKDMIIADLINIDQNIIAILMRAGMHCIGCPFTGESPGRSSDGSWN